MARTDDLEEASQRRAFDALLNVLPLLAREAAERDGSGYLLAGQKLYVSWIGEGRLADARRVTSERVEMPDVVVARNMSLGSRALLSQLGIGWVDETGAAEIAVGMIVVSRTGRPQVTRAHPLRWTASVLAIAEALLCGTKATVSEVQGATGLSTGSCTNGLRVLTKLGLLEADVNRGRASARRVSDIDRLLDAYCEAAQAVSAQPSLQVGVMWRDSVAGLIDLGREWDDLGLEWAATGSAAAALMAPYLTSVTSTMVYVDADTLAGLEAVVTDVGLRPIEGGRLTVKPFPSVAVRRLATQTEGLRVAPWPRVFVDLIGFGVRGEEAAEHLREVSRER